jgi:hypothetical protein
MMGEGEASNFAQIEDWLMMRDKKNLIKVL